MKFEDLYELSCEEYYDDYYLDGYEGGVVREEQYLD